MQFKIKKKILKDTNSCQIESKYISLIDYKVKLIHVPVLILQCDGISANNPYLHVESKNGGCAHREPAGDRGGRPVTWAPPTQRWASRGRPSMGLFVVGSTDRSLRELLLVLRTH